MSIRQRTADFLDSAKVQNTIIVVIVFNAVVLGLETSKQAMATAGPLILMLDRIDFVIVGISLLPASGGLSVLRALRILRVLRVISVAPSLRRVVEGFVTALPGMGSVFLLMGIIFYIGAVIATIMTLESWSMGIVRPVMEEFPNAWAFFLPFILITTFAVVNLLVGLIVSSMQDAHHAEENAATDAYRDEVMAKLKAIERQLDQQKD